MAKSSGGTRSVAPTGVNTSGTDSATKGSSQYYYDRAKEAKRVALDNTAQFNTFPIRNGFEGEVEISKSDIRTITGKSVGDNKFNAIKNTLAQDIPQFIEKGTYEGWRPTIPGKHPEAAFFAYYSREFGQKFYLCLRRMDNSGKYKPYAIVSQHIFDTEIGALNKEQPPR